MKSPLVEVAAIVVLMLWATGGAAIIIWAATHGSGLGVITGACTVALGVQLYKILRSV